MEPAFGHKRIDVRDPCGLISSVETDSPSGSHGRMRHPLTDQPHHEVSSRPCVSEGREETEPAHHPSVTPARRSDRTGHAASKLRRPLASADVPARGVTLRSRRRPESRGEASGHAPTDSPRPPKPHRAAIPLHPTPISQGTSHTIASGAVSVPRNLKPSRDRLQRQHISLSLLRFPPLLRRKDPEVQKHPTSRPFALEVPFHPY